MALRIDHVIYGTRDIDAAGARFWQQFGLASYEGGVHPRLGTGNRIVPFGDSYIEIMGIAEAAVARDNPLGRYLLESTASGDRWTGWCLRPDDIEAVALRIGSAVVPGERRRPDGGTVTWRLTGLEIALSEPPLPFFIAWDDPAQMPGRVPLEHRAGSPRIVAVEVAGDPARLEAHAGAGLPVRPAAGSPGIVAVVLESGDTEIRLD